MKASSFGVQKVKVQGLGESNMLKNALLASLTRYLEHYRTQFHQTFSVDAFWDEDEHVNFQSINQSINQ